MKLVNGKLTETNYMTGKEELQSLDLTLVCKNEEEFMEAWDKIKEISGVSWCGCPWELDGKYGDVVVTIKKENGMTSAEVYEELRYIRKEIEETLSIGKFRKK